MDKYLTEHAKTKKKFKTQSERKKFLKETGVKLVKHPKTGEEMVPVTTGMKMLSGKRIAAARVKEDEHGGDKNMVKDSYEKHAAGLDMTGKSNTKAGSAGNLIKPPIFSFDLFCFHFWILSPSLLATWLGDMAFGSTLLLIRV